MVERGMNEVKGAGKGKVWRDREGRAGDWGLCQEERTLGVRESQVGLELMT